MNPIIFTIGYILVARVLSLQPNSDKYRVVQIMSKNIHVVNDLYHWGVLVVKNVSTGWKRYCWIKQNVRYY